MVTAIEYRSRLDDSISRISKFNSPLIEADLKKMAATLDSTITELSKEEVHFRLSGKPTNRSMKLIAEIETLQASLDEHIVFATLLV